MPYFADLTRYTNSGPYLGHDIFNVGWLDATYQFPVAPTPHQLPALLDSLEPCFVLHTLGSRACELCGAILGNAEIFIPADRNTWFASPSGISHYISAHQYKPPDDFIKAVISVPPSDEYKLALLRLLTNDVNGRIVIGGKFVAPFRGTIPWNIPPSDTARLWNILFPAQPFDTRW